MLSLFFVSCCKSKIIEKTKIHYVGSSNTIIKAKSKKPVLTKTEGQLCTPENIETISKDEVNLISYINFLEWKIGVYEKRIMEEKERVKKLNEDKKR